MKNSTAAAARARPITAKAPTYVQSISNRLMQPTKSSQLKSRAGILPVTNTHPAGNEAALARRLEKARISQ